MHHLHQRGAVPPGGQTRLSWRQDQVLPAGPHRRQPLHRRVAEAARAQEGLQRLPDLLEARLQRMQGQPLRLSQNRLVPQSGALESSATWPQAGLTYCSAHPLRQ